jgi:hypothetical protein
MLGVNSSLAAPLLQSYARRLYRRLDFYSRNVRAWTSLQQQQKKRFTKLKFQLNYNPVSYSVRTRLYRNELGSYASYREARAAMWKCNKCDQTFASLRHLKSHKQESHAY